MSILKTTNAGRLGYFENELLKRGYQKSCYIDFFGAGEQSAETRYYYTFQPDMSEKSKTEYCMYVYYYTQEKEPVFRYWIKMNYSSNTKCKGNTLGGIFNDISFLTQLEHYWRGIYLRLHPRNENDIAIGTNIAKTFEQIFLETHTNLKYDV